MYAIAFNLSVSDLEQHYPGNSYNNAYGDIKKFLQTKGFNHQQGSVYFGEEGKVDAVRCVMAVNAMSNFNICYRKSTPEIVLDGKSKEFPCGCGVSRLPNG